MNQKHVAFFFVGAVVIIGGIVAVVFLTRGNSDDDLSLLTPVERVLTRMPVIDGHNDLPWQLRKMTLNDLRKFNFSSDLTQDPEWSNNSESFTDIPRLRQGKVGGQFWVAYTSCRSNYKDSVEQTLEQIDVIKRLVNAYPQDLQLATSASDIEDAINNQKIASLIAVEGGHSIQSSFAILRLMYEMGARYMTLTHTCNLPWADASPVDGGGLSPANGGLSEFGLQVVDEMNRLGIMVDLSHVSVATMKAALNRSKAPVIFSHSSAKAICDHHRNVDDEVLRMVRDNKGIVMVNFYRGFVRCVNSSLATLADVVEHVNHIRDVCGVDCVGIGADYDGVDAVPEGLEDVSKYPELFKALYNNGSWSEDDLEKLSGRNLLRVFKEVERVRDQLQGNNEPLNEDLIKRADLKKANISEDCVTATFIDDATVNEAEKVDPDNENKGNRERRHIAFEEFVEL